MTKIIKNTMSEPTEITCPACLSVLSYTYQDIERVEEDTLFPVGYRAIKRFIVCPVCKRDIDLIPKVILNTTETTQDKEAGK